VKRVIIDRPGRYNGASGQPRWMEAGDELQTQGWYADGLVNDGLAHYPAVESDGIDDLPIPTRAKNSLRETGLTTVAIISEATDDELLALKWIGETTLRQIRDAV